MNREIKFKVWDSINSEWLKANGIFDDFEYHCPFDFTGKLQKSQILLQYTGISDINGKEIYEGDIVENTTAYEEYCSPAVVIWGKYEYCYWTLAYVAKDDIYPEVIHDVNGFKLTEESPLLQNGLGTYEIIGNIYENPDLLKHETV